MQLSGDEVSDFERSCVPIYKYCFFSLQNAADALKSDSNVNALCTFLKYFDKNM